MLELPVVVETAAVVSGVSSSSFSPDAQVNLRNGMQVTFRMSSLSQAQISNGSSTNVDQSNLLGQLAYSFRLPASISRARKQMQSQLTFTRNTNLSCIQRQGDTTCQSTSDVRNNAIRGSIRTDVLRTLTGSLEMGYEVNDFRALDRKTANLYLLVTFPLSLFAGDYR